MVWKDNFLVDGIPKTIEGFLDEVCGVSSDYGTVHLFDFCLCYFKDYRDMFITGLHWDQKHFPKHFVFANFQCLRCALCCKNYDCIEVDKYQVVEWIEEGREDILEHMDIIDMPNGFFHAEIFASSWRGCPMCRKVVGKPYYNCRINSAKESLYVCKAYLCSKSVPVAHLNYRDVDELIALIGIDRYFSLVEKDWNEEFDYSASECRTH